MWMRARYNYDGTNFVLAAWKIAKECHYVISLMRGPAVQAAAAIRMVLAGPGTHMHRL